MVEGPDADGDDASVPTIARPGAGSDTVVERPARTARSTEERHDVRDGLAADIADDVADEEEANASSEPLTLAPLGTAGSLGGGTASASQTSIGTTLVSSPRAALDHSEILRTRNFCLVGLVIAIGGALVVPQLPGGVAVTRIFLAGIGVAALGLVYLLHRTRTPATFHQGYGTVLGWYIPVIAVCSAVPFFGPFSPVAILLVLGIFVTGLGSNRGTALATYLTCAGVQGLVGVLVIAGTIDDPGFIHAKYLPSAIQLMCQGLIQLVLAGTYVVSRATRSSSLEALSELEKAVRAVSQREALLEEARAELRRALGSGKGRFTDQLIGTFQLGDIIGRGAMGEVYQAVDTRDDRPVAVKMLSQASLGNTQHVQRFLRELQTAAAIDSPNVVRVIAIGEHPLPHLVMERLRGRDLAAILRSRRTLDRERVVELLRQVGAGITAAAAMGVIHRDLKPQNLFLAGATWKILDFGVSRVSATSDTLTAGHVVGTPAYMAPEQARGDTVDHRSDLYSLAAVAYRALTGHPLFRTGALADTLYRVVHTAPRRPTALGTFPRDLDLALAIGLAKDPAARFVTAAELAEAIDAALGGGLPAPLRARGLELDVKGAWAAEPTR